MCVFCDDPTLTYPEFLAGMARKAREYGWAIQGVERHGAHPPWAYTVGLTPLDRPELLVTGMPLQRAARLLNEVATHLLQREPPRPGERMRVATGPLVEFVTVEHPDVHLLTAMALHGPAVRGKQVVWSDDRERWPWERGFRGYRGGQPVLGPRATA